MSVGEAFGNCFTYPVSNSESKYGGILKGGLLLLASIFIIPAFTFFGYGLRMREAAAKNEMEAPTLTEYGKLTEEGFYGFAALLPFMLIFYGLLIVSTFITEVLQINSIALIGLSYIFIVYLTPAVTTTYAVKRNWREIYTTETLDFAFTFDYFIGALVYIIVAIAIFILIFVSLFLFVIPVLFASAYSTYIRHSFWGILYSDWEGNKEDRNDKDDSKTSKNDAYQIDY